ncbi:conserved domain protein [Eggerthella sp. HGA1]|nr:conserved domain protein [Eggerthella sp. HGA1]
MPSRRETVGTRRARQGCMRRYALPWCEAHSAAWSRAEERM